MDLNNSVNFNFPVSIYKSGEESNNRIPIKIIPNAPTFDRVNDKIFLKAFDDDCIQDFLHDGMLDYDHLSVLSEDPIIKAQAHIGDPTNFYIDEKNNVPVCEGFLFKGNPFVDGSIMPALNAGSKNIAASLGGKILKKSSYEIPGTKMKKSFISKIRMKHIAITPLQRAVHQGTSVELKKSMDGTQEPEIFFNSFEDFAKSFQDAELLEKALVAGVTTDIANISGGQALQSQSLEGVNYNKIENCLPFILEGIKFGLVKGRYDDWSEYLTLKGFSAKEAEETIKLLARNGAEIVKVIF